MKSHSRGELFFEAFFDSNGKKAAPLILIASGVKRHLH